MNWGIITLYISPRPPSVLLTHSDKGDYEASNTSSEVGDGHEGASTNSVNKQVEDEARGKLHHSRNEEVQVQVVTSEAEPQDKALKHNSAGKPVRRGTHFLKLGAHPPRTMSMAFYSIV